MPLKVVRWLFARHAPLMLRPTLDLDQWRWLARFVRNCTRERFARNKARMQRIAHYSKACLVQLREETGIAFDHGTGGVLQLFRSNEELGRRGSNRDPRAEDRSASRIALSMPRGVVAIEPALRGSPASFAGGLHLPDDETGDCHIFTMRAGRAFAWQRGVTFRFDTNVDGCCSKAAASTGVVTDAGTLRRRCLCRGARQRRAVRCCGRSASTCRSIQSKATRSRSRSTTTCRRRDPACMDEHYKVMITRLGDRIRAAGVAEDRRL